MGDKVMQIRSNYEKDVFNGDIGRNTHPRAGTGISVLFMRSSGRTQGKDYQAQVVEMSAKSTTMTTMALMNPVTMRMRVIVFSVMAQLFFPT